VVKTPHTVNGRFYGIFYTLDDGRKLYLAHRTPGQVFFEKAAWCLDDSTLRKCESLGIDAVGVVLRMRGKATVYLTHRDDFNGPHSFRHYGDAPQRGLPMRRFRINPSTSYEAIERLSKIGR
jgi:hypothetical protein